MDEINDKKASVSEMMDLLTETPEDPDVDDLMDELDKEIAKDEEVKAKKLPSAPTTDLPNVPTTVQPAEVKNEDEDLEAMLVDLCSV